MWALVRPWVAALALLAAASPAAGTRGLSGRNGRSANSSVPENSPVGKVLALLKELRSQLREDATADKRQFEQFSSWYLGEAAAANKTIEDSEETASGLVTELEQQEALREKENLAVEKASTKLLVAERELKEATTQRGTGREAFEHGEAEVMQAVQQLEHSLEVMGQSMSAPEEHSAASLVDVARQVRAVLLQGPDFSLSLPQRETLDGFLRAALRRSRREATANGLRGAPDAIAPDFLQLDDQASPAGTPYEPQTGSVTTTLQSVLEKAKQHLGDLRAQEQKERTDFGTYEKELKRQIKSIRSSVDVSKQQIAMSEETSGKREADLLATRQLLKTTQDTLGKLQADYEAKRANYQERSRKRDDEILAVQEASEIMTGKEMKKLMEEHYSSSAPPADFLQLQQVSRRHALHALRTARSPGVALMALRSQTRSMRSTSREDPFGKVAQLIKEMIARLTQEYAAEATKAEWCESEMAKSARSKSYVDKSSERLRARISRADVEIEQLTADIKRIEGELQDMSKAGGEATELRKEEQEEALLSIQRYKDSQRLLKAALAVLKKTYGKKAQKASASGDGKGSDGGYKLSGIGAGVVGLLEIAVEDFADLQQETEMAEATAQNDYKELMDSAEVKTAAFNKDLEYKNREKVKLAGDRMRATEDLQNFDKELKALNAYIDQLKVQCPKGETYEQRKARREEEIRQLQDALTALNAS